MADLATIVPYQDPLDITLHDPPYCPNSENILGFFQDTNPDDLAFDPQQGVVPFEEPVPDPPSIPPCGNDIAGPSYSQSVPLFWEICDNPIIEGDHGDPPLMPEDFLQEPINQEEENPEYRNTGFENTIPLASWPPPPVPFNCSCCQVLREINHTNGIYTTKLDIHGRVGLICHAIMEVWYSVDGLPPNKEYQMIDFSKQNLESVKQYLVQYCKERQQSGYVVLQDPLSNFYDVLRVGLNWDENANIEEFVQPSQTNSGVCQMNQPKPESHAVRVPKSSLAAQRERTGRLRMDDLREYFHLPVEVAAKKLAICPTVLKKICRNGGMTRWPHRKIKSVDRKISNLERNLTARNGVGDAALQVEMEKLKEERVRLCSGLVGSC